MLMSTSFNFDQPAMSVGSAARKDTQAVAVTWGQNSVTIGGRAPVVVQSMTNTDTADAIATAIQVKELAQAGSELVRITVNTPDAAKEVVQDRKSTRLNSSHVAISYAVFCLNKKITGIANGTRL